MPRKSQPYTFKDIGLGIDTFSPADRVPEGALSDVLNMDPEANSTLATRKGYTRYYGNIPIRILNATYTPTEGDVPAKWRFQVDSSQTVSLLNTSYTPVLIAGSLSNDPSEGSLDFSETFKSNWYTTFSIPFVEFFDVSNNIGSKDKPYQETGITSSDVMYGASEKIERKAYPISFVDTHISSLDPDIRMEYELYNDKINTERGFEGYFYYKEFFYPAPEVAGSEYIEVVEADSVKWTQDTDPKLGYYFEITNAEHALATLNFVVNCQVKEGDVWVPMPPQDMHIDTKTGTLKVWMLEQVEVKVMMAALQEDGSVFNISGPTMQDAGDWTKIENDTSPTYSITFDNIDNPFNFIGVWVSEGSLLKAAIEADSVYDFETKKLTITYTHPNSGAETVRFVLLGADYKANEFEVEALDDTHTEVVVDNFPLLTVWGIEHDTIYREAALKGGYTHHIDKYSSSEKSGVVSGLGGNLFEALSYDDGASKYKMPVRTIRGSSRVVNAQTLTPFFWTAQRVVGGVVERVKLSSLTSDGYAPISTIYNIQTDGQGNVVSSELLIQSENTLDVLVLPDSLIGQHLTVRGFSKAGNNGNFKILAVTHDNSYQCSIRIANPNAQIESGMAASCNIFSDTIRVSDDGFIVVPGNFITTGSATSTYKVVRVEAGGDGIAQILVDGITGSTPFSDGVNLFIQKTSSIIPLANGANADARYFVRGDVVNIDGYTRKFTVKQVFPFSETARVKIEANVEGYFEIDFEDVYGPGGVHGLNAGDKIILTDADPKAPYDPDVGYLDGEWTLNAATDRRHLRFGESVYSEIVADGEADAFLAEAFLVGNTIELEEEIKTISGPALTKVSPEGRWVTIEEPTYPLNKDRLPNKNNRHFDENVYSNQPYIKSTMVKNSLYLSNSQDEVKKYDGASIYNAGLPNFQPWAFMSVDTSGTELPGGKSVTYDKDVISYEDKYFLIPNSNISVGDRIQHSETKQIFKVIDVDPVGSDKQRIYVDTKPIGLKTLVEYKVGTGDYAEILSDTSLLDFNVATELPVFRTTLIDDTQETYKVETKDRIEAYDESFYHLDLEIDGGRYEAEINEATRTITVYIPYSENTSNYKATLYPEIKAGDVIYFTANLGAVNPTWIAIAPGEQIDVSAASTSMALRLTDATNSTVRTYKFNVTESLAGDKIIEEFSIGDNVGYIDDTTSTIKVKLPYGSTVTNLIPHFIFKGANVKVGAKIQETHLTSKDFTNPVIYTVTDANLATRDYTVTVEVASIDLSLSVNGTVERGHFEPDTTPGTFKIVVDKDFGSRDTDLSPVFNAAYAEGRLVKSSFYRYYARLNATDRNNQIVSSAFFGADDMYIDMFSSGAIELKLLCPPAFSELEHSRLEVELYRTLRDSTYPFRRVKVEKADYSQNTGYITVRDTTPDEALKLADSDALQDNLLGGELGNRWAPPPKAKVMTTADNRLVLGNITSPPLLDVTFRKDGIESLKASNFHDGTIRIRKLTSIGTDEGSQLTFVFKGQDATTIAPDADLTVGENNITITSTGHGMSAGHWVYLFHSTRGTENLLRWSGWYKVASVPDADTFTINISHNEDAGLGLAGDVDSFISGGTNIPVWLGDDGNFNQRREDELLMETRAASRLSVAISAVMATASASSFSPWLLARSGQSYRNGNIIIEQADEPNGKIGIVHTLSPASGSNSGILVYVGDLPLAQNVEAESEIKTFNSRIALSYRNFPEIFEDPYRNDDKISNIIDINPADGQEITAAVPFFGSSAFGSAQLAQAIVVFKTNSIYIVDLASNAVQKLQTQGQGCTAPRSVASTKNGIFFANESGIYRLDTNYKIMWIGKALDGKWNNELAKEYIEELAGHNYAQERRYKLSYTAAGDVVNSKVAVYDSAKEDEGSVGSWTLYDNHPSTGWCNLKDNAFFGSFSGRVYRVRNDGTKYDYRDDASPINQYAVFGATNYGFPDERKTTESVTIQFQNEYGTISDIKVLTEQSLSGTFNPSGVVTIPEDDTRKDVTIRFSLPQRKGTHIRTRIEKAGTLDEKLQISSLTYGVKQIGPDGVPQSKKYRS